VGAPELSLPATRRRPRLSLVGALDHYEFKSLWHVEARPDDVFEVLADLDAYPAWWPEVKAVERLGETAVAVRVRSFLPYELRFEMHQVVRDAQSGVLEVSMAGDLEGFSRWTVSGEGGGSRLLFEEEVRTNRVVLNRLALVARPAFKVNHAFMMRHGEAGLRTYMAGFGRALRSSG
jgi:hypothetical protein